MFLSPAMNACFYGQADPQSVTSPTTEHDEKTATIQQQRPVSPLACCGQPSSDNYGERPASQQLSSMRFHPVELSPSSSSCSEEEQMQALCDDLDLDFSSSPTPTTCATDVLFQLEDEPFSSSPSSHAGHYFDWKLDETLSLSSLLSPDKEININSDLSPSSLTRTVVESDFEPIPVHSSPVSFDEELPPQIPRYEQCDEEQESMSSSAYTPDKFDILCGRHKLAFNHIGNKRFRATVNVFLDRYMQLGSRTKRSSLIAEIADSIQSANGRFLRYSSGAWEELSTKEARNKVGHALRDMAKAADSPGSRRQKY